MDAALSSLPIITVVVLMLGLRWSTVRAGAVGLSLALGLALARFGYGVDTHGAIGRIGAVVGALGDATVNAAYILWIIVPALCLYQLQVRTGALGVIEDHLKRVSRDPIILAILIGWFFTLFLEGAAAFGSTMALAAPFLVALGYRPVDALSIVLVGHAVGASWGALGIPLIPMTESTEIGLRDLSRSIGTYQSLLGPLLMLVMLRIAIRAKRETHQGSPTIWVWGLLAAALFLIPFFLVSRFAGPELPNLAGAALGGGAFVLLYLRTGQSRQREVAPARVQLPGQTAQAARTPALTLPRALSAYTALVVIVLGSRLVPPLRAVLSGVVWNVSFFGHFSSQFQPLYQPGTLLFVALLIGAWAQRACVTQVLQSFTATLRQVAPVTLALLMMLSLAKVLDHAGMVNHMASAAASGAGASWPVLSPFIGALGSFITGSATSSNILFTDLQYATAQALGLPTLAILGAQGFGAGVGNMIALHNIIAGGATVGLQGREEQVLRRVLPVCLIYTLLGGLCALYFVH